MANDTNLKVDGLEYAEIRNNLVSYLKTQSEFQDYNFDSSGLSSLLDLLSYNTYYNMFYTNMASSETFLNTAQKRTSVVTLADSLGYTPRSTTSATLPGTLTVVPTGIPSSITIPFGTKFDTTIEGRSYVFSNKESLTLSPTNGVYSLSDISLVEGVYVTEQYTFDATDKTKKIIINNKTADTSTLQVRVLNSSSDSTTRNFVFGPTVTALNSESLIYYLKEIDGGKFEVVFGSGALGKSLDDGNIIYLTYIVSKGAAGNGVSNVVLKDSISGIDSSTFTASSYSFGGQDAETVDSIKFNAPKAYASQNRAVTAEDYATLISQQSNVSSVIVWGGEDNDPPAYGKVYIAVKPTIGNVLTPAEKLDLTRAVIGPKKILTVSTEIVDPEYIYLSLNISTTFDPEKTVATEVNLTNTIKTTVKNYSENSLNKFSKYFRYSELSRLIDTSERSILSSDMSVSMRKEFDVQLNSSAKYTINFSNPINPTTSGRPTTHPYNSGNQIVSNDFSYGGFANCYLEDNAGLIRIFRLNASGDALGVAQNVGTINYATGQIILDDFRPTAIGDGGVTLRITATPQNKDILPLRGQIVLVNDIDVSVTLINDKNISLVNR